MKRVVARLLLPALLLALALQACATNANMQLASEDEPVEAGESTDSGGGLGLFGMGSPENSGSSGEGMGDDPTQTTAPEQAAGTTPSGDGAGTGGSQPSGATLPGFPSSGGPLPNVDPNSEFCRKARAAMEDLSNSFNSGNQSDPLATFRSLGSTLVELSKIAPTEIRGSMRKMGQELSTVSMLNFQQKQALFESDEFYNVMGYLAACGTA
ncbi:MAG: hypothetical protein DYH08_13075 [Actinobacteria bacterium ATB1]|nr:hypothetical protein [Actinobacteria bacterium ATB1]